VTYEAQFVQQFVTKKYKHHAAYIINDMLLYNYDMRQLAARDGATGQF
jgi:hypothetical protein